MLWTNLHLESAAELISTSYFVLEKPIAFSITTVPCKNNQVQSNKQRPTK